MSAVVLHHHVCYQQLQKWPLAVCPYGCLLIVCLLLITGVNSNTAWGEDLPLATLWKGSNPRLSESQVTHKTLPQGGNPTTADEDEHRNSAVPQYLGQYWGLGSECYMVWWLHSFYKLQQWPAFSVIVVARPGQSPLSPSLLSHCWNWTSIISQWEMTIVVMEIILKQKKKNHW